MSLPALAIKRPVTTVMILLIIMILGIMAFMELQQELMPEMDIGVALVFSSYDGAGPEEIENLITRPLEMALGTVSNLDRMTTTSTAGSSIISLEFVAGTDMNHAALNMRESIDMFRPLLPAGVDPTVLQIDMSMMQMIRIGVTGEYDQARLRTAVEDIVIPNLERLEGVGSVSLSGGIEREISIELDPTRLAAYGLFPQQIAGIIAQENLNRPGGTLIQGATELQVRTVNEFQSITEIENLPIVTPAGAVIRLSDIARVVDGFADRTSYAIIEGRQGIMLDISPQSTANLVEVGNRIQAELDSLRVSMPHLEFTTILDDSTFIVAALNNVWITVGLATIIAMLVLLLFLANFRSPLIIGVSIPVSLMATLAMMFFADITLNMISLNALVIGVGLLIDNSIVVIESISRYLSEGLDPKEAARKGAEEVGLAITAATLTTIAVFVPILFVTGIAGEMFGQLGLVLSFTLGASLFVAMTFVPMACSKFLKPKDTSKVSKNIFGGFVEGYGSALTWSLKHRFIVIILFLAILVGTGSVIGMMGQEFMGEMDMGFVSINVEAPTGGLLDEIRELTDTMLERVENVTEIQTISTTVGAGGGLFGGSANTSLTIIQLTPRAEREDIDTVMEYLRDRIGPIPGAEVTVSNASGMGGASNQVSFNLFGDNMDLLAQAGDDVVQLIGTLPNIRNPESSLTRGIPQANVVVNRQRAGHHGLQASAVANTVQMAIAGSTISRYRIDGTEIDIVMRYEPERLEHITDLHNLMLSTPFGTSIPLSEVAEITMEQGPTSITKQNQRPFITISAEFVDTDLGTISQEITELLDDFIFVGGITYSFGGAFEMMMESFQGLLIALVLGFVLLYMVMASQFESLAYPATILFSIPVAWTAGLLGLFIMGSNIDIVAFIGLILLMGIVTNNGIVLVDYIGQKRAEGMYSRDAIVYAAKVRLRPILMTTITTVFGLMPLLFMQAEGAEMQQGLGAIIVFGLSFSAAITLILIPVLYSILHGIRKRLFARRGIEYPN